VSVVPKISVHEHGDFFFGENDVTRKSPSRQFILVPGVGRDPE